MCQVQSLLDEGLVADHARAECGDAADFGVEVRGAEVEVEPVLGDLLVGDLLKEYLDTAAGRDEHQVDACAWVGSVVVEDRTDTSSGPLQGALSRSRRQGAQRDQASAGDAEWRKAEVEIELAQGAWRDPRRGKIKLADSAAEWVKTRHDIRLATRARLQISLSSQVLPRFGSTPLVKITNAAIRRWLADLLAEGLSPTTVRKAVFPLRQCLSAAVAHNGLMMNPAVDVPLPTER